MCLNVLYHGKIKAKMNTGVQTLCNRNQEIPVTINKSEKIKIINLSVTFKVNLFPYSLNSQNFSKFKNMVNERFHNSEVNSEGISHDFWRTYELYEAENCGNFGIPRNCCICSANSEHFSTTSEFPSAISEHLPKSPQYSSSEFLGKSGICGKPCRFGL